MLIKISVKDGLLHFESDGDTLSALIRNFEELFISNKSMTFHIGDVDGSIRVFSKSCIACLFTRNPPSPLSPLAETLCDEIQIKIVQEGIGVYGCNELGCIIQVVCVNG